MLVRSGRIKFALWSRNNMSWCRRIPRFSIPNVNSNASHTMLKYKYNVIRNVLSRTDFGIESSMPLKIINNWNFSNKNCSVKFTNLNSAKRYFIVGVPGRSRGGSERSQSWNFGRSKPGMRQSGRRVGRVGGLFAALECMKFSRTQYG